MKLVCSKCHTPLRNEFDEVCHKCGHYFNKAHRHIILRPHRYHIVRDIIIILLIIIIAYIFYNGYKPTQPVVNVNVPLPEVNVGQPNLVIQQQNSNVNISDPLSKNRPFEKSQTAEEYGALLQEQRKS